MTKNRAKQIGLAAFKGINNFGSIAPSENVGALFSDLPPRVPVPCVLNRTHVRVKVIESYLDGPGPVRNKRLPTAVSRRDIVHGFPVTDDRWVEPVGRPAYPSSIDNIVGRG